MKTAQVPEHVGLAYFRLREALILQLRARHPNATDRAIEVLADSVIIGRLHTMTEAAL